MTETILKRLREIENGENVRILFAVEAGSRAWGYASPDSDYDVRFVYVRPMEYYLSLKKKRDVLEYPIDNRLDLHGWDLSKALRLLHNANPTLFEWCASPIVYVETPFFEMFRKLAANYFSSQNGMYHYIRMAEGNYSEYLQGSMVKAKKYFYVLRPILACRWILENNSPPPISFAELVAGQLPEELVQDVNYLLDLKINAPEVNWIPKLKRINQYLDTSIAEIKKKTMQMDSSPPNTWGELDAVFIDAIKEYG